MAGGLSRRVALASGVLVVLIAGAFVVLLLALGSTRDSGALARHSRSEIAAANRLEKLLIDIETGQRGFIITHERRFLAPRQIATAAVPGAGARLLSLADDPGQHRRAARIIRAVREYIRTYSVPLVAAARKRDPAASSVHTTALGKRLVDALRASFNRYVATERDLLTARQEEADSQAHGATVIASVGLVGSFVLIVLFASYLGRAIVVPARRAARMAGELADGDLSVRMPETGVAEVGMLERAFNTMAGSLEASQSELRRFADEQAALRRVATLVARGVPPESLLESVASELRAMLGSDGASVLRYEPDGEVMLLAASTAADVGAPTLGRRTLPPESATERVRATGKPAVVDLGPDPEDTDVYAGHPVRWILGAPIFVSGRLWGAMVTSWGHERPRPEGVEARMSDFTELVATAVANADTLSELAASRARVVAAGDEARRRIERDLHDGTQQRLITLGLRLRSAEALAPPDHAELRAELASAGQSLTRAVEELQDISRGIHPAILSRGGLAPALKALARRSAVPVELHLDVDHRLPEPVEVAGYYVVSEALTNAAKHARASVLRVDAGMANGAMRLSISDDGVGGADPGAGSGLVGLRDRVEALGGEFAVRSAPGGGTALEATIPIRLGE